MRRAVAAVIGWPQRRPGRAQRAVLAAPVRPYAWLDRLRDCTAAIAICTRDIVTPVGDCCLRGYAGVLEESYDRHGMLRLVALAATGTVDPES